VGIQLQPALQIIIIVEVILKREVITAVVVVQPNNHQQPRLQLKDILLNVMIAMKEMAIPPDIIVMVIILRQLRQEAIKQVKIHQREVLQQHHIILVVVAAHIVEQVKRDTLIAVVITVILLVMGVTKIHMEIIIATNREKMAEKVDTAVRQQKKAVLMTAMEVVLRVDIRVRFHLDISNFFKISFVFLFFTIMIRNINIRDNR
jgi:hypothetical protein